MPITPELIAWLDLHEDDRLVDRSDGFIDREGVLRLAETCVEVDIEDESSVSFWRTGGIPRRDWIASISFVSRTNPDIQLAENPLTFEEYVEESPGHLELCKGFLGSSYVESLNLLDTQLKTFGLLTVVSRAPRELWDAALDQVYGSSEAEPDE